MAEAVRARAPIAKCTACATELGPAMLSCPACHTLVHSAELNDLAVRAHRFAETNEITAERDTWTRALELLPSDTEQHAVIRARVAALNESLSKQPLIKQNAETASGPWWRRWIAGGAGVVLLALSKLKFLLLGLTKASTFFSMFAFFGLYWSAFGWPLALGLVVSIYIHEMGHVAELKRLGINASAPFFIPGLGALVLLKQHIDDPVTDARIGLAGPLWGLGAGVAAWLVALVTASPIWFAIAQLTGYINLFNLIPVWQLDGSRGFHALGRAARWTVVVATIVMFALTQQKLLLIVGAVGAYRAFQPAAVRTDRRTLFAFVGLIAALSFLAEIPVSM